MRQVLLLRERLIAEQRTDDVRTLDRNLFLTPRPTGAEHETNVVEDDDDEKDSLLLSPKERLRCASEMEKSVDSLAVAAGADVVSAGASDSNKDLMLRCIRAMQSKHLTPACLVAPAVEVKSMPVSLLSVYPCRVRCVLLIAWQLLFL